MPHEPHPSPVGVALAWVSRIMAIGITMFLPGVAGSWLDARFGSRLLGPLGFLAGLGTALFWLVSLGRRDDWESKRRRDGVESRRRRDGVGGPTRP